MKKNRGKKKLVHPIHDEKTFYQAFISDLEKASKEIIILSPFMLTERMEMLFPIFEKLLHRKVKIYVVTRPSKEYKKKYQKQGEKEIHRCEQIGVQVRLSNDDNRNIAIIDRGILWEGSLDILSQIKSRDIMYRIEEASLAQQMFDFIKL